MKPFTGKVTAPEAKQVHRAPAFANPVAPTDEPAPVGARSLPATVKANGHRAGPARSLGEARAVLRPIFPNSGLPPASSSVPSRRFPPSPND
ncbi:hypothetical protein TR51_10460 [Kitasatospora griseola]|uniref:Uncharacterized protein n=1 Tax=Kitasatospora griseola TaxID=2064 RepID=A0A0D0PWA2_KITGR|nr:hypothetical protein [Kitasatospora griseola]KIQ64642.1 hypothetical protein TR51_10460 [Kitasatospora griseola]